MDPATLIFLAIMGLVTTIVGTTANISYNDINREDSQEFTASENALQREFTAEEAEKSRQFEEYMSSTAMQRQVADYKAAGINVGAIGGSGATSGATATGLSSPMAMASHSAANIMNTRSIDSYINAVAASAAKQTLKQNSTEFGDNLTRSLKSSSARYNPADYEPGGKYYDPEDPNFEDF